MDVFAKTNGITDKCVMGVSGACMCYSNSGGICTVKLIVCICARGSTLLSAG